MAHDTHSTVRNENGIYMIIVAILAVTLFTIIGLGIDAGRLFLAGLDQQRAADAGAVAGAYFMGSPLSGPQMEAIALNVARDNFEQNRIAFDALSPAAHFRAVADLGTRRVSVRTDSSPQSFFMGPVVEGRLHNPVNTDAVALRQNVAVDLVFDVTGSMDWEAFYPNGEPIRKPDGTIYRKIELAVQAAQNFSNHFNAGDRLGLVTYSNTVNIQYPVTSPYNPGVVNAILQTFTPRQAAKGATNISLGLMAGLFDMLKLDPVQFPNRIIVLVTDGTPNLNAKDNWQPFQKSTHVPYALGNCSPVVVPGECTNTLINAFPSFPSRPAAPACQGNPGPGETEVHRQNFVDAMHVADQIRQHGIKLVTVAMGPSDPTVDQDNPWGTSNVWNTGYIRENFMRWLANDAQGALDNNDRGYPNDCAKTYPQMDTDKKGLGLVDRNLDNIDSNLQTVASYLTLQLVD